MVRPQDPATLHAPSHHPALGTAGRDHERTRSARRPILPLAVLGLALALAPIPVVAGRAHAGAAEPAACVDGLGVATEMDRSSYQDVQALGPDSAIAVGGTKQTSTKRRQAWAWWDGTAWTAAQDPAGGDDEVLQSVAGDVETGLWTVGFSQPGRNGFGIARRWEGDHWTTDSPPRAQAAGETLIAVDVDPEGGVWAVGMRGMAPGVRSGLMWHHTAAAGWVEQPRGKAGSAYTGVAALASDDVWVVGSRVVPAGIVPIARHWDGTAWSAPLLPDLGVEAVLTGAAGTPGGAVWAVGWRQAGGAIRPLVLRYADDAWAEVEPPDVGGAAGLLLDVAVDAAGNPWVGGASHRPAEGRYVGVVARRNGPGWTRWARPADAPLWVSAISGDPATSAWLVGRGDPGAMLRGVCEPTPGPAGGRSRASRSTHRERRARARTDDGPLERLLPPPATGLRRVPRLRPGGQLAGLVARDIAAEVGLDVAMSTYGADVGDLDGDGAPDLFISGHGSLPSLWLRAGDQYVRQPRDAYTATDRHDCAIGTIAGGPLPDVVCTVGADGGMGIKANELWLDPGSGTTRDAAAERGLTDPLGRGRKLALFDADGDGDLDLLLGNQGMRYDGQASPTRLMRNDGDGRFTWDPSSGLTSDQGAECVHPVDIDLDGDQDLVICRWTGAVVSSKGLMIARNDGDRFRDATATLGVDPIGEVDAVVGQLGGGPRPDLVQLSTDRIRISIVRKGRFVPVYERRLERGRSLALGDVDGDGAQDVYIQRGGGVHNDPDVVLHNDGTGQGWTPIAVPSTADGTAESVLAFDHDGDGRDDFLVLNGWLRTGPVQLITFQPAAPAGR